MNNRRWDFPKMVFCTVCRWFWHRLFRICFVGFWWCFGILRNWKCYRMILYLVGKWAFIFLGRSWGWLVFSPLVLLAGLVWRVNHLHCTRAFCRLAGSVIRQILLISIFFIKDCASWEESLSGIRVEEVFSTVGSFSLKLFVIGLLYLYKYVKRERANVTIVWFCSDIDLFNL